MEQASQSLQNGSGRRGDELLHIRTIGIDEMSKEFSRLVRTHDVTLKDRQRDFVSELHHARLARTALSSCTVRASMDVKALPARDVCLVFGAVDRPLDLRIGGQRRFIPVGGIDVVPPNVPFELYIPAGVSKSMMLQIELGLLETVIAQELRCDVRDPLRFLDGEPGGGEGGRGFMDLLGFIQGALLHNSPQCRSRGFVERLEALAAAGLIRAKRNNYSGRIEAMADEFTPRFVLRAEDHIYAHAGERLTLGSIAAASAVSSRTLVRGFHKYKGCSPGSFLRSVRLDRCRDELLAGSPEDVSVTLVAVKWGFSNLGRFAALYRERFGENPATTLRRTARGH